MTFIAMLLLNSACMAQICTKPELIPYRKGKKWGYCNSLKEIKIPLTYDLAREFNSAGQAIVKKNGKEMLINTNNEVIAMNELQGSENITLSSAVERVYRASTGKFGAKRRNELIIDSIYDHVELDRAAENKFAIVRQGKTGWAIYDIGTKQLTPVEGYDSIAFMEKFEDLDSRSLVLTYKGKKSGWWNLAENLRIEPQFDRIWPLNHELSFFGVSKNKKWALAASSGKLLSDFKYKNILRQFKPGLYLFFVYPEVGQGYFLDCEGTEYFEN